MPWVRFDDSASDNPHIDSLSDGAFRLWFNSICFSNRNLTDGFIPNARIPRLTPHYRPKHADELVDAGRWHKEEDGVRIHGYLEHQPSAAQVAEQREYERQRKAERRARGKANTTKDPTNGQFVSRDMSHRDNNRDSRRDSHGLSQRVSPATQPNPTSIDTSSSSLPVLTTSLEEEEEEIQREAKRRLASREAERGPVTNRAAWLTKTCNQLKAEGWKPTPSAKPRRPDCATCDSSRMVLDEERFAHPCPDCMP